MFETPTVNTAIQIAILSDQVSQVGYYQIPRNLSSNPLNANIQTAATGDIREHYETIFYNAPGSSGPVLGANNYRDLGNIVPYGTKIVKNSASLVLPATFLRKSNYNLFNSLMFNSNSYVAYKNLLLQTVYNTPYSTLMTASNMLDDAIEEIASVRDTADSFFWSDMLPARLVYTEATYTFASSLSSTQYPLSTVYDFTKANYNGVLVYLTRTTGGATTVTQLVRGRDYTVSTISPELTVTKTLLVGDIITVKEYNQTYGSYVPNTPTKLGVYPATIPSVVLDDAYQTPTYFIVGHDGSYTKLYGDYDPVTGTLYDSRDQVLLEFETRVYNNLKVSTSLPIDIYGIIPGFFRNNDYNYDEFVQIYSTLFLNWVGKNNIEYKRQYYDDSNEFTWNYRDSGNRINGQPIDMGYWRGVYLYLYDTTRPDEAPWEMLHYTNKPSWWDSYYGTGPYTSDNTVLWEDLAAGYDWNGGSPRTISSAVRPQLLQCIPVDSTGKLLPPFQTIVGNYMIDYRVNRTFRKPWAVADVGPAEFSYRRSSSWPFDLIRIMALMRPAQFYNLAVDLDNYVYNSEFNQYLVGGVSALTIKDIQVYGDGTAKTSYINWIVDYEKQFGVDATTTIEQLLKNLDVRLAYRMAGYSDPRFLKFFIDSSKPTATKSSLLVSDDSYNILLHDNQAFDRITYSGVVIQISSSWYRVYG